jgi:hypothetical protein
MITLPNKTRYGRSIAKEKFYEKAKIIGALKQSFIGDIAKIIAEHKISAKTLNITKGKVFAELHIFRILLKKRDFNIKILDAIDKAVHQYILFVIEYENSQKASIAYKEKQNGKITTIKRFTSDWTDNLELTLDGNSVDLIYENYMRQISKDKLKDESSKTLSQKVDGALEREKLERLIECLKIRVKNEKQFNKKIELNSKLKLLIRRKNNI